MSPDRRSPPPARLAGPPPARRASLRAAALAAGALAALAALPSAHPAPRPPVPALGPASLVRVDVTPRGDLEALVEVDLTFTRGAHRDGDVAAHVAHGSPGLPRAFEAHLIALEPGHLGPPPAAPSIALATAPAMVATADVALSLGPREAAGQRVELPARALAAALAPSGLAALRLRWLQPLAATGPGRTLLVRATDGRRLLPLGALSLHADPPAWRDPRAWLCGAETALPLRLSGPRLPAASASATPPPLVPPGARGDLCFAIERR